MRSLLRILFVVLSLATAAVANDDPPPTSTDLGHETPAANDGWAAFSTGTTGGVLAAPEHIFKVRTREELVAALGIGAVPKIVYVMGTIDANVDTANLPLTCADYAEPGYTIDAYLQAYDPATWGRRAPTGTLETLRRASQLKQQARVRINVTANTTIVGFADKGKIVGANLRVNNVDNVIIRNLTFEDAYDCFPAWDPLDGALGNWNSQYDNVSLTGATHVWVDHTVFNDGAHPDSELPIYFGRRWQVHDGALDITNASDLVTVSWSRFVDHDKVMLIGSSDTAIADRGKLRVTVHHNLFERTVQRGPRVRFGQVHVYDNLYVADAATYSYSFGVGIESQIVAEENLFETIGDVAPDRFISRFNGTAITADNTLVKSAGDAVPVDIVAEYNAVRDPDLSFNAGWTPALYTQIHPAEMVHMLVRNYAGLLFGEHH